MTGNTVTRSIETDLEPGVIFDVLKDPRNIPQWAPAFANNVEGDALKGWQVSKDGVVFRLNVAIVPASRTVDYLREIAPGKIGGAYIRVLPLSRGGSVVVMTLPISPGGDPEQVTAILDQELSALAKLCESSAARK